ncbi:MAG: hypothetical protein ACO3TI_04095 [Aquiluna sp.]|jgi:hypothetical protein
MLRILMLIGLAVVVAVSIALLYPNALAQDAAIQIGNTVDFGDAIMILMAVLGSVFTIVGVIWTYDRGVRERCYAIEKGADERLDALEVAMARVTEQVDRFKDENRDLERKLVHEVHYRRVILDQIDDLTQWAERRTSGQFQKRRHYGLDEPLTGAVSPWAADE